MTRFARLVHDCHVKSKYFILILVISNDEIGDNAAHIKVMKRELKQWENQFFEENGRKPDKKDIAAIPAIGIFLLFS